MNKANVEFLTAQRELTLSHVGYQYGGFIKGEQLLRIMREEFDPNYKCDPFNDLDVFKLAKDVYQRFDQYLQDNPDAKVELPSQRREKIMMSNKN